MTEVGGAQDQCPILTIKEETTYHITLWWACRVPLAYEGKRGQLHRMGAQEECFLGNIQSTISFRAGCI